MVCFFQVEKMGSPVVQMFSKSRSCRWSISPLFSVTVASSNLILLAVGYGVQWNHQPRERDNVRAS